MTNKKKLVQTINILATKENAGLRLDKYLATHADVGLTRSKIERLIDSGDVKVNDHPTSGKYLAKVGDRIAITIPELEPTDLVAEDLSIEIIYQDEHLAVVNKPAGMVTHPAAGNYRGTLVNALLHHFAFLPGKAEGVNRPGIVHRLDKNTSGLLVVARTETAFAALQKAIAKREIVRTYWAIVCGHLKEGEGTIDLPIGRSARDRKKMAVTKKNSREARTHYKVTERYRSHDLLEITLDTGRTHQIRVHLSHLGHPVLGDPEYGGREGWHRGMSSTEREVARQILNSLSRQALHAIRLELTHPITGEGMKFESRLPEELVAAQAPLIASL